MLVDGIMQLVLNGSKEILRNFFAGIVVNRCRIDIRDLLVEIAFRRANIADSLQKLLEITVSAVFQPFIVKGKTLLNEFMQPCRGPPPESCGYRGLDTVTDGDDDIEIVMSNLSMNLPFSFLLN